MTPFIHPEDVTYTLNSWHGDQKCGNCAQFADCPVLVTLRWDGGWCELWVQRRETTSQQTAELKERKR